MDINQQLRTAARNGSIKDVERGLRMANCDPLALDSDGSSALMCAAAFGREACVEVLLPVSDPLAKEQ